MTKLICRERTSILLLIFPLLLSSFHLQAQLKLSAQLRTRSEFRDGQGSPLPKDSSAAFFTSQRTRLSLGYTGYRIQLGLTVQDVRVWGQDGSTINRSTTADNNGLMIHEAWAEILFTDTANKKQQLSLKVGRQELVYDDQRLIGNLDWLQQARRHDAAVVRFNTQRWLLHAGFAFNQNREKANGTGYNPAISGNYAGNTNGGSNYKSFEYLYVKRQLPKGNLSFLFFTDQFSEYQTTEVNNVPVKQFGSASWSRFTTGFYLNDRVGNLLLTTSAYYQGGKTASGQPLSAALLSANFLYDFSKKLSAGPGVDFTSGGGSGNTSHAFDPLYGTPHKFWGSMDYFYAGNGFGNKGLIDCFVKANYRPSGKLKIALDLHQFVSASEVPGPDDHSLSRNFGTESDLVCSYSLSGQIGFEAGYSHYFGTSSLSSPAVKNINNASLNSNWAYLGINILIPAMTGKN
jgi:hypothetical protein